MVKFRRNNKSDVGKHDSIKQAFHIPEKNAVSIVPPKKVIKALYDYDAPTNPPHYLSFSQGDFLHVVARENDEDWYEACNPLQGTRGLVPVKYFDIVGKTARDSRHSTFSAPHDSGYSDTAKSMPVSLPGSAPVSRPAAAGHRPTESISKMAAAAGGAMVYGVVVYDFHAERPDELDAKQGEAIIVIAQSNPEWFVAKPITRLGGPGLIPVSFIEIKDMTTGSTVNNTQDAIARAGIPKVEEWKKMTADYKNTSIPLGTIGAPQPQSSTHSRSPSLSNNNNNNNHTSVIQQGMNRLSLNNNHQQNGYARTSFSSYPPQQYQQSTVHPTAAAVPSFVFADEKFHFIIECSTSDGSHWNLSRKYEDFYELQINLIKAFPEEAGQTGQPRTLPYMPGPVQFVTDKISEGRRESLDEYLRGLLRLGTHITKSPLVSTFFAPRAGDDKVDIKDDLVDAVPPIQGTPAQQSHRFSLASQRSPTQQATVYSSPRQQQQGFTSAPPQHQRQLSSVVAGHSQPQQPTHSRNISEFSQGSSGGSSQPLSLQRQATSNSGTSLAAIAATANASVSANAPGAALKVKVWFDRDTCVIVRMPPKGTFRFSDLYHKIVERRKLEYSGKKDSGVENGSLQNGSGSGPEASNYGNLNKNNEENQILEIEYRDERDGEYYKLAEDAELAAALDNNEKLTLVVREVVT